MAIRNIVCRGFGNGTFSASRFATRGFDIGDAVVTKTGPILIAAVGSYQAGPRALGHYNLGPRAVGSFRFGPVALAGANQ